MNGELNIRLAVTKAVLWFLLGLGGTVAIIRFLAGLGATTDLTDLTPWGMWIGFDVVGGVALAAGGFVIAAAVKVFHLKRYQPLLRPAVLTAFLGYVAVVLGLLVDLGRPWNIWRPTVFWQPHSALFEVAWCVMLYLTVLALEFAPVVFEGLRWSRAFAFFQRLTLPLVVVGIALSTLHQSSLGTLMVIAPNRIHPLWYSPLLPPIFLISAIALGLAMVTVESLASSWLYRREPEWPLLAGITRAAAWALTLYLVVRLGDLAWRGSLASAIEGSWAAALFTGELLISAVVPILLFSLPSTRGKPWAITAGATLVVGGLVLQRANTAGISHVPMTGDHYIPALTEISVSLAVVSGLAIIFLFFVEKLRVWEEPPAPADRFRRAVVDPVSSVFLRAPWFGGTQRAALALTVGAITAIVMIELGAGHGLTPRETPTGPPRTVLVSRGERLPGPGHRLLLASARTTPEGSSEIVENVLLIDADRGGKYVLFEHELHQNRLGGVASCGRCHHRNLPLDRGTSCSACHRDMYLATDTFSHSSHVAALRGNQSCALCHHSPEEARSRRSATACATCHAQEASTNALVRVTTRLLPGVAPGYRQALHGLCIECHRNHENEQRVSEPFLSRCPACHRERSAGGDELRVREGVVLEARRAGAGGGASHGR